MARSDRPASFAGATGAGLYGGPAESHVTACPESHNPFGHNPECKCGWVKARASQKVPYYPPERAELHEYFDES